MLLCQFGIHWWRERQRHDESGRNAAVCWDSQQMCRNIFNHFEPVERVGYSRDRWAVQHGSVARDCSPLHPGPLRGCVEDRWVLSVERRQIVRAIAGGRHKCAGGGRRFCSSDNVGQVWRFKSHGSVSLTFGLYSFSGHRVGKWLDWTLEWSTFPLDQASSSIIRWNIILGTIYRRSIGRPCLAYGIWTKIASKTLNYRMGVDIHLFFESTFVQDIMWLRSALGPESVHMSSLKDSRDMRPWVDPRHRVSQWESFLNPSSIVWWASKHDAKEVDHRFIASFFLYLKIFFFQPMTMEKINKHCTEAGCPELFSSVSARRKTLNQNQLRRPSTVRIPFHLVSNDDIGINVESYCTRSNEWSSKRSYKVNLQLFSTIQRNGKLILVGGTLIGDQEPLTMVNIRAQFLAAPAALSHWSFSSFRFRWRASTCAPSELLICRRWDWAGFDHRSHCWLNRCTCSEVSAREAIWRAKWRGKNSNRRIQSERVQNSSCVDFHRLI